ncbi:hypothetical protein MPB2EB_1089 [Mycoavidus sp. B2-EB]|nr:hypothetical protein MPB2EB_1089 [Mycoavidus sp. B2-EB]
MDTLINLYLNVSAYDTLATSGFIPLVAFLMLALFYLLTLINLCAVTHEFNGFFGLALS